MLKTTIQLLLLSITLLLINCTGRGFTDVFREKQYRKMDHVQRKLKKAVNEAEQKEPTLLDTTTHTKNGSFAINKGLDTTGVDKKTNMLSDSVARTILLIDTVRHTTHIQDTVYSTVKKALQKERKIVEKECNGIVLKDTLVQSENGCMVKIWQQGDSLRIKLSAKSIIIKDCPECKECKWWLYALFGFLGGIVFVTLLLLLVSKILKSLKG